MKILIIILIVIALIFFSTLQMNKSKFIIAKHKNLILNIVIFLAVFSMIAVLISFYLSRDLNKLYPITLPILLIIIAWSGKLKNKRNIQQNK